MPARHSIEDEVRSGRFVLSMRVKVSIGLFCVFLVAGSLVSMGIPRAVEALRGLAQDEVLVENESQSLEQGIPPSSENNEYDFENVTGIPPWITDAVLERVLATRMPDIRILSNGSIVTEVRIAVMDDGSLISVEPDRPYPTISRDGDSKDRH